MRILIACLLWVAVVTLTAHIGKEREARRHARFVACVENGTPKLQCGFKAAFEE